MADISEWLRNLPPEQQEETIKMNPDLISSPQAAAPQPGGRAAPDLEALFEEQIQLLGLPPWEREYRFRAGGNRRFRFDFCWQAQKTAVEINGGQWVQGRHNRGSSLDAEYEKINLAVFHGWRLFLFSTNMVRDGSGAALLLDYFTEVLGHELK